MKNIIIQSIRALMVLTLLTGVFYPLTVTLIAQAFFFKQANGSLIIKEGKVVGSELLAQNFTGPSYFWPRPSSNDYNTLPGGASNLGPTSSKLKERVKESLSALGISPQDENKPYDLLLASGSGLDPHITPENALFQLKRVASARNVKVEELAQVVETYTEKPFQGVLGKSRINVLKLNLALDRLER